MKNQQKINIKILEGMRVTEYAIGYGNMVVSSSKKIEAEEVTQEDIDLAMAAFVQDNAIMEFCGGVA